ncbi:MAG TPA: type II toxin-antitoxin system RelE/ParE family toxin [bacterium]|nr:type II toxin-antitoxin system RelE/ParE family toxin [bacterium]
MPYRITIERDAAKAMEKIPLRDRERIGRKIDGLADDPRPPGVEKLQGFDDVYRIRSGQYRIVYQVEDDVLLVLVVRVGHRKEVYRGLGRRTGK